MPMDGPVMDEVKLRLTGHPAPTTREIEDDWPGVLGRAPWFLTRKAALKS